MLAGKIDPRTDNLLLQTPSYFQGFWWFTYINNCQYNQNVTEFAINVSITHKNDNAIFVLDTTFVS